EAIRLFSHLQTAKVDGDRTLRAWDLTDLGRRPFATLSGGQRQRLFLALALLGDPDVVFLDELTAALDPNARRATWDLVRQVRDRGATVVLVTHFMEEAEALCDRIAVVDGGKVIALDTPAALASAGGNGVSVTFTANGTDPAFLSAVPGVRSVSVTEPNLVTVAGSPISPITVASALNARGMAPTDFRTHHPSLEDAFLALTGVTLNDEETS
ncbi:MAG: ATP-binding cassette domain-containing protein, partial [Acidimicrobiia bacterium]